MKHDSAISIGNRIKSARMLSGLSRPDFCEKTGISLPTLSAWESPPKGRNGLTDKGAELLIAALKMIGILCLKEWLLFGSGASPKLLSYNLPCGNSASLSWDKEEAIIKDIESFKKNNSQAIVRLISDDLMLPLYPPDAYVGGCKIFGNDIARLVGTNCIIKTEDGDEIVRRIQWKNKDFYLLIGINLDLKENNVKMKKIEYAAEIIWVRKRSSLYL